jgi:hypothetical protein
MLMNKICFGLLLSLIGFNTFSQNVTKFKASESLRVLLDKHGQFLVATDFVCLPASHLHPDSV